jgi:hypothetical protein
MPPDVTREQNDALMAQLRPMRPYLGRLQKRMEKVGFLPDDQSLKLVTQARDAMHDLSVDLHYESCRHQVGRKD